MATIFRLSLCLLPVLLSIKLTAQTILMQNANLTVGNGFFSDSGGEKGNYGANENFVLTLCPDRTLGTHVQLDFPTLAIASGDVLCFYDGADTLAPRLLCLNGNNGPMSSAGRLVRATAANPSGCLTVQWRSLPGSNARGWLAGIQIIRACQAFEIALDSLQPRPVAGAGVGVWSICPNTPIQLFARGLYAQNNLTYRQEDSTTVFTWEFGGGLSANGQAVQPVFNQPGRYTLRVQGLDVRGCRSTNFLEGLIVVAPPPRFVAGFAPRAPLCFGDSLALQYRDPALSPPATLPDAIRVEAQTLLRDTSARQVQIQLIPDGVGGSLVQTIRLNEFAVDQTLDNANDLVVYWEGEHSRLQDLTFTVGCPNGRKVILHEFPGAAGFPFGLGTPITSDNSAPRPGTGQRYSWAANASNASWVAYLAAFNPTQLPSGRYQPQQSFGQLLGCPLNGNWTLEITDRVTGENGFNFAWGIALARQLWPAASSTIPLTNLRWRNQNNILFQNNNTITVKPQWPGRASFPIVATDSLGCRFDSAVHLTVLAPTTAECASCQLNFAELRDTFICEGSGVVANLQFAGRQDTTLTFQATPQYRLGHANHPPERPYAAILPVAGVAQDSIDSPVAQIEKVCVDIATDWNEDLRLFLRAPSGEILELSTNNGGGSDNYTNTCFSPLAGTPIQSGTGPFTGTFQPEGDWNVLRGATINGEWALLVSDSFDLVQFGEVRSWEITFRSRNSLTYQWSPQPGLSCTDCPNPLLTPTQTTRYVGTARDRYGCIYTDSLLVTVLDTLAAPRVRCLSATRSSLTFAWNTQPGQRYRIRFNTNGRDSLVPIPLPDSSITLRQLSEGQTVSIFVTPYVDDPNYPCSIRTGSTTCTTPTCNLQVILEQVNPLSCPGRRDGSVIFRQTGNGTVRTTIVGPQGAVNAPYNQLDPGNYLLTIIDTVGCTDTAQFRIESPDSLAVTLAVDQAPPCFGQNNGAISSQVAGGDRVYSYAWSNGATSANLRNVPAGRYELTVSDSKGCFGKEAIIIAQPDSLVIGIAAREVSCPNATDGQLQATVTGGTAPYIYLWTNGSTTANATRLPAANYCVSVSDARGCLQQACASVPTPPALRIDSFSRKAPTCFGSRDGEATVFASGGRGSYRYLWSDTLAQNGQTARLLRAATFQVTVRDSNNCVVNGQVSINQPTAITVRITPTSVICKGSADGSALAVAQGGTRPYSFRWDSIPVADSLALNLRAGQYSLTVTDANGCTTTSQTTVPEPALALRLRVRQTRQGCFGTKNNDGEAQVTGGDSRAYTFQWSNGQTGALLTKVDSLAYQVTVTDALGCQDTASLKLIDLPDMEPNAIVSLPSCFGSTDGAIGINLILGRPNADLNAYQFRWNTGQTGGLIRGLRGDSTYTVTITDPIGCVSVKSRRVRQPRPITFSFAATNARCNGSADGSASVVNIQADTRNFRYQWEARANNQTTMTAQGLRAGRYSVTVTDEFNCFATNTVEIKQPEPIAIAFNAVNNRCFGDAAGQLQANATGGTPAFAYRWSSGDTSMNIRNLAAGVYGVTITDRNGCQATNSTSIAQPAPLQTNPQVVDVSCNQGRDGRVSFNPVGGRAPYSYSLNNRDFRATAGFLGLTAGRYTVFVKDANGCTFPQEITVAQPPPFSVDAGSPEYTIRLGDSLELRALATNPQGQVQFTWTAPYPGTLSCTTCPNPTVKVQDPIAYRLTGIDEKGCEASAVVNILVLKTRIVEVPTGFTPNQDGQNDLLLVHGQPGVRVLKFQVFDRWGEQVYADEGFGVNDATRGWDGTFRNQVMNPGIFIWFLEVEYPDGYREIKRGQTTLIR